MLPIGKAKEAVEQVRAAAQDASAFLWAILGLAAGALLLGAVALVKASKAAR